MRRRFITNREFSDAFDMSNYMTIEALEDGLTVVFTNEIEYGVDGHGWKKLKANTYSTPINAGQCFSFKGNLKPGTVTGIGSFKISKPCNLSGNVMSLIFYDDAANNYSLDLSNSYYNVFSELFNNCTTIQKVSQNFLPATTLASSCYNSMFYGCTGLTTAPELPATKLAKDCYNTMFYGCTKLNYIKMLATDISASYCLDRWVSGVSPTGTFVKNPDATWEVYGDSGIPNGWTVKMDGEEDNGLISFTIDDEKYNALPNMTWGEWVNSEYNTSGFIIDEHNNSIVIGWHYIGTETDYVHSSEVIQEDYNYVLVS